MGGYSEGDVHGFLCLVELFRMPDQQPDDSSVPSDTSSLHYVGAIPGVSADTEGPDYHTIPPFDQNQYALHPEGAPAYLAPQPSTMSSAPTGMAPQTLAPRSGVALHLPEIPIPQPGTVVAPGVVQRVCCTELLAGNHVVAPTVLHYSGKRIVFPFPVGPPLE